MVREPTASAQRARWPLRVQHGIYEQRIARLPDCGAGVSGVLPKHGCRSQSIETRGVQKRIAVAFRMVRRKKSQAQTVRLRRNVRQRCPLRGAKGRRLRMYRWTVRFATRMPSFRSSPRMRSAPQSRFSSAILRINAIVETQTRGSAGRRRRQECHFQKSLNPSRCQRTRVSGRTSKVACGRQDAADFTDCRFEDFEAALDERHAVGGRRGDARRGGRRQRDDPL